MEKTFLAEIYIEHPAAPDILVVAELVEPPIEVPGLLPAIVVHDLAIADIDANVTIGLSPAIVMDSRDGDNHAGLQDAWIGLGITDIGIHIVDIAGICSYLRETEIAEDQRDPFGAVAYTEEWSSLCDLDRQIGQVVETACRNVDRNIGVDMVVARRPGSWRSM